jgi:hypothetical protein
MSRYNDISQLLDEIGASDRSAGDPWTISRGDQGTVKRDSFSPAVVADLGGPAQELTSDIQSSEKIAKADEVVTSPTGTSAGGSNMSSMGSGILGGFLSLFPLASVVGKLFGLGGSSSPPPLTPYIQPPSVNFEGAMSSGLSSSTSSSLAGLGAPPSASPSSGGGRGAAVSGSGANPPSDFAPGFSTLSYGANGLPRTTEEMAGGASVSSETSPGTSQDTEAPRQPTTSYNSSQDVMGQLNTLTKSPFAAQPAEDSPAPADTSSQPQSPSSSSPNVMAQLDSLTNSNFNSQPAADSPIPSADLMATTNTQPAGSSVLSSSSNSNSASPANSDGTGAASSQQGQSILVQVQAMDSQSFMDHSNDIAQAVRQAMLNLHSVNDVIADL